MKSWIRFGLVVFASTMDVDAGLRVLKLISPRICLRTGKGCADPIRQGRLVTWNVRGICDGGKGRRVVGIKRGNF